VGVDRQLDLDLGPSADGLAAELGDRLADEPDVEVEADVGDVAGLLAAEQVARAADLEVLHRDLPCRRRGRCAGRWSRAGRARSR
jgi:hypothetical protein